MQGKLPFLCFAAVMFGLLLLDCGLPVRSVLQNQARAQSMSFDAVHKVVFSGITAAEASDPLPSIGQTLHLICVVFPEEVAEVGSLQVRIEAAFASAGPWFPISPDITTAPLLGGLVYQMTAGYMPFPYVRVNSLNATPGAEEMTVYYSGHRRSPNTVIEEQSDRFIL